MRPEVSRDQHNTHTSLSNELKPQGRLVRDMTKISAPPIIPSPTSSTADTREEQAVLKPKHEDAKEGVMVDGSVPLTPPVNALAPSAKS